MPGDTNGTNQVLCTGEAGSGKTTLSKRLAWLWATGRCSNIFWTHIKAVIFISPKEEEDNLQQTMRNAIPGKKAYKDLMMDLYVDEPEALVVIVEGFNEFQNQDVIKGVIQMLKDQATNVFLTIRTDSPQLNPDFIGLFNRSVEVKGFGLSQSAIFVRKVAGNNRSLIQNEERIMENEQETEEFVKAIEDKLNIFSSPLNLSLACLLYSEGELKPSDMPELTEVSLYMMREYRMVERECLKGNLNPRMDSEAEIDKVHKLAVYLQLTNKVMCSKNDLNNFGISLESPVMVLLQRKSNFTAKHGNTKSWAWPHSRLYEFDVAMGLAGLEGFSNSQWMYWLASNSHLNSVAKLVVALLGTSKRYEEIKALTTATILLQNKTKCSDESHLVESNEHPCIVVQTFRMNHEEMYSDKCFSNGQFIMEHLELDLPTLASVYNCIGSPFNNNFSLFKHVQECWELGCLCRKDKDYIKLCQTSLLPAVDRYSIKSLNYIQLCCINTSIQLFSS